MYSSVAYDIHWHSMLCNPMIQWIHWTSDHDLRSSWMINWLVVFRPTPLKNHGLKVSWDDYPIPNWMESQSKFHGSSHHQPVYCLPDGLLKNQHPIRHQFWVSRRYCIADCFEHLEPLEASTSLRLIMIFSYINRHFGVPRVPLSLILTHIYIANPRSYRMSPFVRRETFI